MNPLKRYILQVVLWLGIWCMIWISVGFSFPFIRDNGPTFIMQGFLILGVIYYTVPKLLFQKKIIYFLLISIIGIILLSFICTVLVPRPTGRPPLIGVRKAPPLMVSRAFSRLLIMSITCVLAVLIETFVLAQEKEKSESLARAALIESELKFLKMQINPHFLFNALNNIYALSVINSVKTQEGISTLSLMLRYVLYDCEKPLVPLRKELEYITHFIELFKLKSSEGFKIGIVEEVERDNLMVAPMLFVPFIENAFKHSGIEKRGDRFVNISLKAKKNTIEFSVENSLPSEPMVNDTQGGIGLQNVKKRLNILYPHSHQLDIKKDNTFRVHLKLKLK